MQSLHTLGARTLPALLCAAVLAACGGGGSTGANQTVDGISVDGELNVGVRVGSIPNAAVEALIATQGEVLIADARTSFYRVALRPGVGYDQAAAALVHPDIVVVEPNYLAWGYAAPSDPYYATSQYSAKLQAELEAAWDAYAATTSTRGQVVIAVLDTGIRDTHEDLVNKVDTAYFKDYVTLANTTVVDDNGHGTQLAGIAAAEVNNAGIAGVASWDGGTSADPRLVKVMPVKVADATNVSNHAAIAAGMSWAVAHGANIILVSLGSKTPSWTLQNAVQQAYAAGVLVVAAAGNDGTSTMRYPAAYQGANQGVLSVTSVNAADALDTAHKANYGSWVNVLAPGAGLTSTGNGSDTEYVTSLTGTSFAAAHAAGVAALVWSAYVPSTAHGAGVLTVEEVRSAVLAGVDSYDRTGSTIVNAAGGRINPEKALAAARTIQSHAAHAALPGSVVFNGTSLRGGATATGTVVLTDPAPAGTTTVVTLSSSDPAMTVPGSVTVLAGYRHATFAITTIPVTTTTPVTVTATAGGVSATGRVDLVSPGVTRVVLSPATVVGGANATGTVTLAGPAPAGGVDVNLASDSGFATFATTTVVNVAEGRTSGTFTVNTSAVTTQQTARITASANGTSAYASLVIKPTLASVAFTPTAVKGGATSTLKIVLNGKASSDLVVDVEFDDSTHALTPESLVTTATILTGATSKSLTVTTLPVVGTTTVRARASYGGVTTAWATLTVNQPSISTLTASTGALIWWDASHVTTGLATVTLDAAVASTTTVYLSSSDSTLAVPSTVTIAPGARTARVVVTPAAVVGQVSATVMASLTSSFAVKKTCSFQLKPAFSNMTLASAQVAGGASVRGTVTLSAAAPTGGFLVSLASSAPSRASVDPSGVVTVNAGQLTATFDVTTTASTATSTVTITASANGVSKSASLKVTAPGISTFTFDKTAANVGDTVTGTITLGAAAVARTAIAITATDGTAVPVSSFSPVYVGTTLTSTTFTFTVGTVASQKTVTVTATLNGTPKTATLTVRPASLRVAVSPTSVAGGGTSTGTVTLGTAAGTSGTVVNLTADPLTLSTTALRIGSGGTTGTFTVTTVPVDADTVTTITATSGTATATARLTVTAPTLFDVTNAVTVNSTDTTKNVVVTLTSAAGPAGVAITIDQTGFDTGVATLTAPAGGKVAAGATTANIAVNFVATGGPTTFTVTVKGVTRTVTITGL